MNILIERNALKQQFNDVRTRTVHLCAPLKPEDFSAQPIEYVSPPKWHLGHTTWFFETFLLKPYKKDYKEFGKNYDFIFNSYYESVGKRALKTSRGNFTRPTIDEIMAYRAYVDHAMGELIASEQLPPKAQEILKIGLHHEQQHQELLIYDIKYILGTNPLFPAYLNKKEDTEHPMMGLSNNLNPTQYKTVEEGIYEVGHAGEGFCFDNEQGRHKVYIQGFQIQDGLITNGEYMEFMAAGGYEQFHFWLSEGWQWIQDNAIRAPMYWHLIDNTWHHYTLYGLEKVNLDAPVSHISFYEADAFAQWKGQRLPTEFEWEVACNMLSQQVPPEANMLEKNLFSTAKKSRGNFQFFGDCWEWTSSAYRPYPYFKASKGALGEYNGKFMINQMVLRGGSYATPRHHIRSSYRNFFHPQMRWPITGLRLAKNLS